MSSPIENRIIDAISDGRARMDVVVPYSIGLSHREEVDWKKVNEAIMDRWSPNALDYIKKKAWEMVPRHPAPVAEAQGREAYSSRARWEEATRARVEWSVDEELLLAWVDREVARLERVRDAIE